MNKTNIRLFELAQNIVGPDKDAFTATSQLFDEHILDSFGLIQLVGEIDREFSIAIKTEDLTIQNFSTINNIATLVDQYIASKK
ncbi:MAG: acyl carrier protein [Bacteriovorax sp.]|nr:acyl carrier protein [Bacteriovorax sp.]